MIRKYCKSCGSNKAKAYYDSNRELVLARKRGRPQVIDKAKKRQYWRKAAYGLTQEMFLDLLVKQEYKCAICLDSISDDRMTHVDHDHSTGQVRGLLCFYCNTGLGKFRDNPASLQRAIEYLEGVMQHR